MRLILDSHTSSISIRHVGGISLSYIKTYLLLFAEVVSGRKLTNELSCNRQIFTTMIKEYNPMISKMAYSYSNTKEDYDDLRQDIMVNLWKGLQTFRFESQTGTWVY
ncbi:MAG: hypothetical protein K2H86_04770, partial [Muribaculaceae bacterium]|nr:hypothetical protein [Muribaculaceae bacterium]